MTVTNIADYGVDYKWNDDAPFDDNIYGMIEKTTPKKLFEIFMKHKTLRWQGPSYRMVLGTYTVLEELILKYHHELSKQEWFQLFTNATIWDKWDGHSMLRMLNVRFRHEHSDVDGQMLMNAIAPNLKTKEIYHKDHTDIMYHNKEFSLFYFKALNDRITMNIAEKIYSDFKVGGDLLSEEAQNFLIDNNKHIQKIIEEAGEMEMFPPSAVRDLFLF